MDFCPDCCSGRKSTKIIKKFAATILIESLFLIFVQPALAGLGVGVGLGSIKVNDVLRPGGIYQLPAVPVVNTGDVSGFYHLQASLPVEYLDQFNNQEKIRRENLIKDWIHFDKNNFYLKPSQTEAVGVSLHLPFDAPVGEYSVYLEASTKGQEMLSSGVIIGPAAATRLLFRVGSASGILGAFKQRVSTFWNFYQPWTTVLTVGFDLFLVLVLLRTIFSFSFQIKTKQKVDKSPK